MKLLITFLLTFLFSTNENDIEWKKFENSNIEYKLNRDRSGYRKILFKSNYKEKVKINIKIIYLRTGEEYIFKASLNPNQERTFSIKPYLTEPDIETGRECIVHYYYVYYNDIKITELKITKN